MALLLVGYAGTQDYFEAAAFVVRAAGMTGVARRAATLEADAVTEAPVTISWRDGQLRGRTYTPSDLSGRPILLVPGVHAAGIDEPRLINFAREIAATGHPVLTAELTDLARYQITPRTTDMIEDAADWATQHWMRVMPARDRAAAIIGISFGGGLSIVAASRMGERVGWVLSFGGHGDLPRTLRYLCTGILPDGRVRPPHDYGVVIILLGVGRSDGAARAGRAAAAGHPRLPQRVTPRHGGQAARGARVRAGEAARRNAARAGAHVHDVGQHPRRRPSRAGAAAARRGDG